MCQNSCLQIFERFVLWVVESLILLTDTQHILAKLPSLSELPCYLTVWEIIDTGNLHYS